MQSSGRRLHYVDWLRAYAILADFLPSPLKPLVCLTDRKARCGSKTARAEA